MRRLDEKQTVSTVRRWVDSMVVGLNLCPFARPELAKNRVRIVATEADTEEQLLLELQAELERLDQDASLETTLLAHPQLLADFGDYNQFLDLADALLVQMGLEGIYQVASFHPDYQFDGTAADDEENFTNRSPYPLLHILREDSLERAIATFPDVDQIPLRNIQLMNRLGRKKLQALLQACVSDIEQG